jgi:hypothetical protein
MGGMRNAYILAGKRPLGKHRCRWEDNISIDVKETACEYGNWIQLA